MADLQSGPIKFQIPADANFIDLKSTMLHVEVVITDLAGKAYIDAKNEGVFVNNMLHSIFSDIIVKIGDTIVEGGDQTYAMKAYIDTMFAYSTKAMEKQLMCSGFYKDASAEMDTAKNTGYISRQALTTLGAVTELYGKPMLSIFQQNKYLLNRTRWSLKLIRSKPEFALMSLKSGEKPRFEIKSASLVIRKIVPNPAITMSIERELAANRPVIYPVNHVEVFYLFSKEKVAKFMHDQLFYNRVPKMIVMAMLDNEALNGSYTKNPFNFKPFDVSMIDLKINGISKPQLPIKLSKTGKNYRAYMSVYEALNIVGRDSYLPFTYDEWKAGYSFFVFNTTPDRAGVMHFPDQRASLRLDLTFDPAPTTPVTIVLYAVFDANIFIAADGVVTTDFSM